MQKLKNTKTALIMSVASLVTCMAMFVGSTFAWFTDSVSTGVNKITAGNLDIDLEYTTDFISWQSVEDKTDIINPNALWEPGHTEVVYLKISNAGSLAFKYQFAINIASEQGAVNVGGDPFKLSDYIKFGVVEGKAEAFDSRTAAIDAVSENATAISAGFNPVEGYIDASGQPQYAALVLYMPETVANEANYRGSEPSIELGISVVATQNTVESDAFGPDYDSGATYPIITVNAQDDISQVIENADNGTIIKLSEDIALADKKQITVDNGKSIEIDLAGNTLDIEATMTGKPIYVDQGASLKISGGGEIITDTASYLLENRGDLTLEGIEVNNVGSGKNAIHNYGALTIRDCDILATYTCITNYDGVIESIEGCTFTVNGTGPRAISNTGSGRITQIKDTDITATASGILEAYAIYNTTSNNVIGETINCNFIGNIKVGGGITFVSGSFKNTALNDEQFGALVADGSSFVNTDGDYTVTVD